MNKIIFRLAVFLCGLVLAWFFWLAATIDTQYLLFTAMRTVSGAKEGEEVLHSLEELHLSMAQWAAMWQRMGLWVGKENLGWQGWSWYPSSWVNDRFLAWELMLQIVVVRMSQWRMLGILAVFFWLACLVDGASCRSRSMVSFRAPLPAISSFCGIASFACLLFSLLFFLLPFAWSVLAAALLFCLGAAASGMWLAHFHRLG